MQGQNCHKGKIREIRMRLKIPFRRVRELIIVLKDTKEEDSEVFFFFSELLFFCLEGLLSPFQRRIGFV